MRDARSWRAMVYRLVASGSFGLVAVPFVLPAPTVGAAGGSRPGDGLKAPGDCTQEKHKELQDEVTRACSLPASCLQTDSCFTLEQKMRNFEACIAARVIINKECFRGGDKLHNDQIKERQNGLANCDKILKKNKEKDARFCDPPKIKTCPLKP